MEKIYTLEEAHEALSLDKRTIIKLISEGSLIAKKCGRQWRITETALSEFIHGSDKPSFQPSAPAYHLRKAKPTYSKPKYSSAKEMLKAKGIW